MSLLSHRPDPRSSSEKYSHICSFYRILHFTQYLQQNRAYLTDRGPSTSINRNTRLIQKGENGIMSSSACKNIYTQRVFTEVAAINADVQLSCDCTNVHGCVKLDEHTHTFTSVQIYGGGGGGGRRWRRVQRHGQTRTAEDE